MIVIADAGPLIALAKIGALDTLIRLYDSILTPPAVYAEAVTAGSLLGADDAALLETEYQRGVFKVHSPTLAQLPSPAQLGPGEEESIRLAIELKADWLLMDDSDARRAAELNFAAASVSTAVKGTLGVLVSASEHRHLTRAQAIELIEALKGRPDIWISAELCDQVIDTLRHAP